jgi:transcriptional regulator with XRE-family HTH domain
MQEVSEVIRDYQYKNNLTQHTMAGLFGISQATYNNWINKKTVINPTRYYPIIAKVCKIKVDKLIPKYTKFDFSRSQTFEKEHIIEALNYCQKYSKNLEEINTSLKLENERILKLLATKEEIIIKLQEDLLVVYGKKP